MNILGPNIFDPKLTRPKLFQTKRTRWLAHLPSFCELVSIETGLMMMISVGTCLRPWSLQNGALNPIVHTPMIADIDKLQTPQNTQCNISDENTKLKHACVILKQKIPDWMQKMLQSWPEDALVWLYWLYLLTVLILLTVLTTLTVLAVFTVLNVLTVLTVLHVSTVSTVLTELFIEDLKKYHSLTDWRSNYRRCWR